jgi:alcohol dehydrogenase (cytochrome c)
MLTLGIGEGSAGETSVRDGVYTEAQADRGAKTFDRACIGCHDTTRFVGELMKPWENQSAHPLFEAVCRTMPEDNPGTLPRQQCADILAYIFKLNGFKAGSEELKSTDEAMKAVRIEGFQ